MKAVRILVLLLTAVAIITVFPSTAHATFPGKNGRIAFQAQTDAGIQIFTVRPNGQGLQQITHVDGDAVTPDWSPDGRQIVFEIDKAEASSCGASVAIMNADGSNLLELSTDHTICDLDPSFTPDGARIVFDRFDPLPSTRLSGLWIAMATIGSVLAHVASIRMCLQTGKSLVT
jgi:Tol biopolymer transport system component